MRRTIRNAIALSLVAASSAFAEAAVPVPAIVQSFLTHRPIVTLHVGTDDGVNLGDRCVILEADRPVAAGTVFYVEPRTAGVRLIARSADLRVGQAAFIIPESLTRGLLDRLPSYTPRYAEIVAVAPGARTAWLDLGALDGVKEGDTGAVIRNGAVAQLGHIALADESTALMCIDQAPRGGVVTVGDRVRVTRADDDAPLTHVREAVVTDLTDAPEGRLLVLSGASPIDFAPERRVDLFRGEEYVGFATVVESDVGRMVARTEPSLGRVECQAGDTARLRPPADIDGVVRRGWAFIVDRNYALVSLGEFDGIERGDRLFGPSDVRPMLELVVQSVYPDHCGAALADEPPQTGSIPLWAEFRNSRIEETAPAVGKVFAHPLVEWLAEARVADGAGPPPPGTPLLVGGPASGIAVVIDSRPDAMLLYTPSRWRLGTLHGRSLRLAAPTSARANEPLVIDVSTAEPASTSPRPETDTP